MLFSQAKNLAEKAVKVFAHLKKNTPLFNIVMPKFPIVIRF